ncbi:MAG: hypothetical protein PUP92_19955 [Rhizonema sp. PD38]|nr:hypothetical protein [Rhizonema sp. PD38]
MDAQPLYNNVDISVRVPVSVLVSVVHLQALSRLTEELGVKEA